MQLNFGFIGKALAAFVLYGGTAGAEGVPNRDELLRPYPNPAWTKYFTVEGHATYEIAPGLYSFRYRGALNIFMVTEEGVIATDPISEDAARVAREEIRKVTDKPVKYVVYSHDHWDHVLGGQIYKDEGAQFISHENCAIFFKQRPNPGVVMPDITFSGNYTVELGSHKLELIYLGVNHGDCLVVMRPDDLPYLFVVDLVTPGGAPLDYIPDYELDFYIETLKTLEGMDFEIMIASHGVPLAHKSAITERRSYLEALMAAVKAELDKGADRRTIPDMKLVPEFSYLRNYDRFLQLNIKRILSFYAMGW